MSAAGVVLLRDEAGRAVRSRWFAAYAALFLLMGAVFVALGQGGVVDDPRSAVRSLAGLMHVLVLFVPIMAIVPAIASVADDRESGMLEYTLAQPTEARELLWAKWLGVAAAVVLAVALGLVPGGVGAVMRGTGTGVVGVLVLTTALLALTFVSLGFLLASWTASRAKAMAVGVVVWLGLVVLGTLGLMTAFVRGGVPEAVLATWSLANPVEAFRMALVTMVGADVGLLGPVGAALTSRLGAVGVVSVAVVSLLVWAVGPALIAVRVFERRRKRW